MKKKEAKLLQRLKILRLQMNPHFMYNALTNLNSLIRQVKTNPAIDYNTNISKLLRLQLEAADADYITLEKELYWIELYTKIEQQRTENLFTYSISYDSDDIADRHIPPMLIQPFIENSIIHGFKENNTPFKKYHLSIKIEAINDHSYSIHIRDNGVGFNTINSVSKGLTSWVNKQSIAMKNIHERISIINNQNIINIKYDIQSLPTLSEGFYVSLRVFENF
ncbi:MAG: histidine kinase [Chitinophagaceae bacterium]|jgi:LytS/YehU family sensor histidine kinase|nr:histidine kinase [Chitinophagaceae bacterium]